MGLIFMQARDNTQSRSNIVPQGAQRFLWYSLSMKNKQRGSIVTWVLAVIILVLVVGGGLYIYYANKNKNSVSLESTQNPTINQSNSTSGTADNIVSTPQVTTGTLSAVDMSNWKTYTNTNAGFSIQYSPDRTMHDSGGSNNIVADIQFIKTPLDPQNPNSIDIWSIEVFKKTYRTKGSIITSLTTVDPSSKISINTSQVEVNGTGATRVDASSNISSDPKIVEAQSSDVIFDDDNYTYDIRAEGATHTTPSFQAFFNSFKSK